MEALAVRRQMIEQLTNRYKVLSTLGEGGMGVVFLVEDAALARQLALKVLSKISGEAAEALLRFKQEFRTMTRLRHPNTVEVYDYGQLADGTPFFTMEVVPGKGLDELLPLPTEDFQNMARQLARALGYIHRQGLVHCDIKPENIRIKPDGTVKLMDFGLMVDTGVSGGTIRGTIAYMAPEVARRGRIDARADLYSFGALAYHLLAGVPPFPGEDPVTVIRAHLEADVPALRALAPHVSVELEDVILRLLEKDPRSRFQSVGELSAALGDATADEGGAILLGSPLVGRQSEITFLSEQLSGLKNGKGNVIWLVGEQGIGKTRLLEEFRFQVQMAEVPILAGHVREGSAPYGPFIEMLRGLLSLVSPGSITRQRGVLARLLPELDDGGEIMHLEPNQEQYRLRAAFGELVSEACVSGLVLTLDDWHMADDMSCKLLAYLQRNLAERPLLIVIASRSGQPANTTALQLAPLDEPEVTEMVQAMLGGSEIATDFLESFVKLTGGSPLYIESSLRHLCESGVIVAEHGRWMTRTALTARHLPGSIKELLREQIARLSEIAISVARAAAMVGRASALPLLAQATMLAEDKLFEALEELRAASVLVAEEGKVAFLQGQLAEVIRDDLPQNVAKDLSTRIAHALEEQGAEDLQSKNELARLFLRSHDRSKASLHALWAGQANLQLYALSEANEFLEAGLPLVSDENRQMRLQYLHGLANLARYRSDLDLAMERYQSALALALELSDGHAEAKILISMGILYQIRNQNDLALEVLTRAEAVTQRTRDDSERLRCLQTMARVYYKKADPLQAIATCELAVEIAKQAAGKLDPSGNFAFLGHMYVSSDVPGLDATTRIQRGVSFLERAVTEFRRSGDKVGLNNSLNLLGNVKWSLGRYQEALQTFEENLAVALEVGAKNDEICAYLNLAIQSHELGEFRAVDLNAGRAHREATATKSTDYAIIADILRAVAMPYLGSPQLGERLYNQALARMDELPAEGRNLFKITILPYIAELQLFIGQFLPAMASAEEAWQLTQETGVREYEQRILTLLGEAHVRLGELTAAQERFTQARELGEAAEAPGTIARARGGLALVALRKGDLEAATREATAAYAKATASGAAYLASELAILRGRSALLQGERAAASV
ncbi:MAG: protein kinase, partial [Cyanobacteria bacterium NC_groundwater_1444_Ag_S-0.65um_54_12]|nr:protein kinase [Cyanobacteria bacterium NC_groundwater_1444_Ag_S-0.65um_54_12]